MNPRNLLVWIISLPLVWHLYPVAGLIGYDCGGAATNITTLSLLEVGDCDIPQREVNVTRKYIQLIQINQYGSIHVMQCKVEIYRVIRICGMFSHTSDVLNGEYAYIDNVSRDNCRQMHREGIIKVGQTEISGIKRNATTSSAVVIAGSIDSTGKCEGVYYTEPSGIGYKDAVVKGSVQITLMDYTANVNVDANKVILRSGTTCNLNEGLCVDMEGGNTYWDPLPEDTCKTKRYGLLYEGFADQTEELQIESKQIVYSMTEDIY